MLEVRTTKAVQCSLHTNETHKLCFRYKIFMLPEGMKTVVDAYKIIPETDSSPEQLELVPGGGSIRTMTYDEVFQMIPLAQQITPVNDNPVLYFEQLVGAGIKLTIVSEGYWKGQLAIDDFE